MPGFTQLTAVAAIYDAPNVDTDQILPAAFLKQVDRSGLDQALFHELRSKADGSASSFVLDQPGYTRAGILITGQNFGCGSSREMAPWALEDFGIRCLIGPSFADIFRLNCINNGLLPISAEEDVVVALSDEVGPGAMFEVDLAGQTILTPSGVRHGFLIDADEKRRLMNGLDPISASLAHLDAILDFESRRP